MKLEFHRTEKPGAQPHHRIKNAFSMFKDIAAAAGSAALGALLFASPCLHPVRAAQVPSSVVWVSGMDLMKAPVRSHFTSSGSLDLSTTNPQQMPLGQMVSLNPFDPYTLRDPGTGMAYALRILHGFFYAGGDSLRYRLVLSTYQVGSDPVGAIRDRAFTWEIAKYGSLPHRNVLWSSCHSSYASKSLTKATFPVMSSNGVYSADMMKYFDYNTGTIRDTSLVGGAGPQYAFCRAWNYGQGNWGSKRRWLGVSSVEEGSEGVGFFDHPAYLKHQSVRGVFPLPNPDNPKSFLNWVCDTVFWKISPYDTTSPYDLSARVDSVRFMFAQLDSEQIYVAPYTLQAGETSTVTVKPYDVFKLPIPARLIPFSGYDSRKGTLADPWYQLANITAPEIDAGIHGLVIAPMEVTFYQDSTAKCGPWYTRMGGRTVKNITSDGMTDTGANFVVDSLVMERFVRMPASGDTAYLTLGDEYSKEFRVPDSCYGAHATYDPLITGFLYGLDYTTAISTALPAGHAPHAALKAFGNGRFGI